MTARARLYEHLLTSTLDKLLRLDGEQLQTEPLASTESPERLARHVAREVERALRDVGGDKEERLRRQMEVVHSLLGHLRSLVPPGPPSGEELVPPPRLLLSVHHGLPPNRTELPFSISTVLTRARGEPALGHELAREIATADRIDALVSFVTLGGVRALRDALETFTRMGGQLRLLTTTYTGATESEAVELLARMPRVEVRVSYDTRRTRLHAKAWLFSRESELDTAYVGSANLSSSALFQGHEWMVKVTRGDLPAMIEKIRGTFETLWNDTEFEPYDACNEANAVRLREALAAERGVGPGGPRLRRTFFTLQPYPFQSEILERLDAERRLHGRTRNLLVAATGTGKTVVCAFDYHRRIGPDGVRPRLLFLAHRQEILQQALDTFRQVLRDGAFGQVLADGLEPISREHLFATIQSFNSRGLLELHGPQYWQHVVIDECHHAPAPSYRAVAERIQPEILVGLTATPERSDGQSLLPDFNGHIAAELRLWHALDRQLLAPFEYYGISDNTNLRGLRWSRGAYVLDELDGLYTGNDRRADLVLEQTSRHVGDLHGMRALGFCVSVAHAEYMARKFSAAGIPAEAVHGSSDGVTRQEAPRRLEHRLTNVIFTCDLYNEGIDLPFVDTLLLLRPTSSATLFMQQLGRGLRLHERKQSCLVLDFIGQHHEDYRFDQPLSAMTGLPRGLLREAVERGFPLLPTGCHLQLDVVARQQILDSLRRSLRGGLTRLREELLAVAAVRGPGVTLTEFLADTGRDLDDVFSKSTSWTGLRRAAGLPAAASGPQETMLARKLPLLLHLDDPDRLRLYQTLLQDLTLPPPTDLLSRRRLMMLAYLLFHERQRFYTPHAIVELLRSEPGIRADLLELFGVLQDRIVLASKFSLVEPDVPLALHRQHHRREVLAAVGRWTEHDKPESREGVVRLEAQRLELFFVTLDKSETRFKPTTRYEDYALSPELFHWQTQSTVTPESRAGRRYVEQAENGWRFLLFVRPTVHDSYTYLGPVRYVSHRGSRPMSITWRLATSIPARWLSEYERLAA